MAATPSLFLAADGPLPSRRADAAADRNSSAAPGRAARRVLWLATQRLAIARPHSTDTRKVQRRHRSVTRGDDPKLGTCTLTHQTPHPRQVRSKPATCSATSSGRSPGSSANSRRMGSGTPARSRLMRGGSPAAGTDHVWAAAAHISPLCKVADPADDQQHKRAERRVGARLSTGLRVVGRPGYCQRGWGRSVCLCSGALGVNVRICRVADFELAAGPGLLPGLLEPLSGTTGSSPCRQVGQPCQRR